MLPEQQNPGAQLVDLVSPTFAYCVHSEAGYLLVGDPSM